MGNSKNPFIKVSHAYEQGKEDAINFKKCNPTPSKWIRFLGLIANKGLKSKYEQSYKTGYFEVVKQRKEQKKKEKEIAEKKLEPKPSLDKEFQEIDHNIKELERRRRLLVSIQKQKEKAKGHSYER